MPMTRKLFLEVQTWVFDLDETLYPSHMNLFPQIEAKMTGYVMRTLNVSQSEADRLRNHYWSKYGTTLAGLMKFHDIDPEPYLQDVHDISLHPLKPDPALRKHISRLPGRKIVYTNGTAPYAERVLKARGLNGLFDGVFGIEHAAYEPKPNKSAFLKVFKQAEVNPTTAAMFEDVSRNLVVPYNLGMKTVHVGPTPEPAQHIDYHTDDLSTFLSRLS